ncbi:MAG: hypothetical protein KAI47_07055, partial [Deltaproteobacteria bacterium]|nr:hypothetical protein [Deltaproteobacteria bacterium]
MRAFKGVPDLLRDVSEYDRVHDPREIVHRLRAAGTFTPRASFALEISDSVDHAGKIFGHTLEIVEDIGEGVVDLVGDTTGQGADRLQFLRLTEMDFHLSFFFFGLHP